MAGVEQKMESQKGVDMKKTIFAPSALVGAGLQKKSNQVLVVEERKIVSITDGDRRGADLVLPEGTVLLPGMIDCHTHLALDARIPGHLGMMEDPEANQTLRALKSAQDDLASGITGLRCLGDRYYLDVLLRDQGVFDVPWMQVAGIGMKGLHGHGYVGKGFSGKEEFRRQCRENIYHHVDWLKIFITPGTPPVTGEWLNCFLAREEVRTVVEEAKSCGLKTSAHCLGGLGLQYCVEEGIDVLDHCYYVDDKDIDLIMLHKPTICYTSGIILDDSRLPFCPKAHADAILKTRDEVVKRLTKLVANKPAFVIGSDAYHGLLYREVGYMVQLGMSAIEALSGVTVYAGEMMGRKTGQLTAGYDADCIAVGGDPLSYPDVLGDVRFVMKAGKIIR